MTDKNIKNDIVNYVNFSLCVVLSFAGGFFTLARLGPMRTVFIVIAAAVLNSFVRTKWYLKVACFGVFGYVLHSFYGEGYGESLVCALFCAGVMLLAQIAFTGIKKKKALPIIVSALLIMSTIAVHVLLLGSPLDAFKAKDAINGYISENYIDDSVEKSEVRYDRSTGYFVCDINSVTEPTEIYTLVFKNSGIYDPFRDHVELSLMKGKRLEAVNALRAVFPDDGFAVESNSIQGFVFSKAGVTDDTDHSAEMVFDIYISAYLTEEAFAEKAASYMKTLLECGIKVSKINFYGGRAGLYYRCITLLGTNVPQRITVRFVPHCFADALASRLIRSTLPGIDVSEIKKYGR